jgi:hypothetical protein
MRTNPFIEAREKLPSSIGALPPNQSRDFDNERTHRTFLERTSEIDCPAEQVQGWIELGKGHGGSVRGLGKGASG